jgi:uncharacterized protein
MDPGRPLPMFPLSTVLFPGTGLPLHVFEARYRALVADCLAGSGEFGVVLIARGSEVGGGDERVAVGTVASVEGARRLPDGRFLVFARGMRRLRVQAWLGESPYPRAAVVDEPDTTSAPPDLLARAARAVTRARALASELGAASLAPPSADDPPTPDDAWSLCAAAPLGPLDHQRLLEARDPGERLTLLVALVDAVGDDLTKLLAGG